MVRYYYPRRNPSNQTVTFPSGTVCCDAFRNLAHGTCYRITLKPHELKESGRDTLGHSNAARRRRGKIMRRIHLLDPSTSNR